ncbi:MAG: hypothetical protein ABIP28_06365 [Mucilaginibacter sp.]
MFKTGRLLAILAVSGILLQSCESAKILTIENSTGEDIYIITRPEILNTFDHQDSLASEKTYRLLSDSSLYIYTLVGNTIPFQHKIKEKELTINYMQIITPLDTIIANNTSEIIELLYNKPLKKSYRNGRKNQGSFITLLGRK